MRAFLAANYNIGVGGAQPDQGDYVARMSDLIIRPNAALEGRPAIERQRNRWVAGWHFGDTTYGKVSRPVASQIRHAH